MTYFFAFVIFAFGFGGGNAPTTPRAINPAAIAAME